MKTRITINSFAFLFLCLMVNLRGMQIKQEQGSIIIYDILPPKSVSLNISTGSRNARIPEIADSLDISINAAASIHDELIYSAQCDPHAYHRSINLFKAAFNRETKQLVVFLEKPSLLRIYDLQDTLKSQDYNLSLSNITQLLWRKNNELLAINHDKALHVIKVHDPKKQPFLWSQLRRLFQNETAECLSHPLPSIIGAPLQVMVNPHTGILYVLGNYDNKENTATLFSLKLGSYRYKALGSGIIPFSKNLTFRIAIKIPLETMNNKLNTINQEKRKTFIENNVALAYPEM